MSFLKNKIAIGTVQFGLNYGISNLTGQTSIDEVIKIINVAQENEINTLDTAFAYGKSEKVLGKLDTENFKVITKFIGISKRNELEEQFYKSLDHLNRDSVYGYLAHIPNDILKNKDLWSLLQDIKHQGKIEKIGFSFNSVDEIQAILEADIIPDLIQVPFNILDNRFVFYMKELKEKYSTEVHTRSTFLQGLFFMDTRNLGSFFDPIKNWLNEIQDANLSGQLIKFATDKEYIDKVVIGVNDHFQLINNLDSLKKVNSSLKEFDFPFNSDILTPNNWPTK